MKEIILLGASGSIGKQTIDVIESYPEKFALKAIAVHKSIDIAFDLITKYQLEEVCVFDEDAAETLKEKLSTTDLANTVMISTGMDGLIRLVKLPGDTVVNALVGSIGIVPTIEALKADKNVALANKETLVAAGDIVMEYAEKSKGVMMPVDSEHSAIFQCLEANYQKEMKQMIVTASGGALRDYSKEQLRDVTKAEVLKHPNWAMGEKITVDCATMMNKAFEVIEAKHLFNVTYERIHVMIQRESKIHSMVEYIDGSVLAHFGVSDMRIPIQYALTHPERLPLEPQTNFDWSQAFDLHFEPVDLEKYPAFAIAVKAGEKGGTAPAVLNAANEIAVWSFLDEKIAYLSIIEVIQYCLDSMPWIENPTLDDILETDRRTREMAKAYIAER